MYGAFLYAYNLTSCSIHGAMPSICLLVHMSRPCGCATVPWMRNRQSVCTMSPLALWFHAHGSCHIPNAPATSQTLILTLTRTLTSAPTLTQASGGDGPQRWIMASQGQLWA